MQLAQFAVLGWQKLHAAWTQLMMNCPIATSLPKYTPLHAKSYPLAITAHA